MRIHVIKGALCLQRRRRRRKKRKRKEEEEKEEEEKEIGGRREGRKGKEGGGGVEAIKLFLSVVHFLLSKSDTETRGHFDFQAHDR